MASVDEDIIDIGLGLEGTHCLITGACGQIGNVLVKAR